MNPLPRPFQSAGYAPLPQPREHGDADFTTGHPGAHVGADISILPGIVAPVTSGHLGTPLTSVPPIALDSYFYTESNSTNPDPEAVKENGRTYNGYKDGQYWLPNDATEQDRLDLQHVAWRCYMRGDLHWAPMIEPRYVLDVGTGTGIWALAFADKYPTAKVIGTDLSRIQPWGRHPYVEWVQADAEDDWAYLPGRFDYVHFRMMMTCFQDPKTVMRRAYEHLCPGGWIEYQDGGADVYCHDTSSLGTSIHRWLFMLKQGAKRLGRDLEAPQYYKQWLQDVGFIDIKETIIQVPGNPWPDDADLKDVGKWALADTNQGIEGLSLRILANGLGMPVSEILQLVAQVKTDMSDTRHRFYWTMRVVYGRKPRDALNRERSQGG
ncbi:methyltransferase domain-containing protein [Seiridium cupressi]